MVKAVKPEIPQDAYGRGSGRFTPGRAPAGGFTPVWDYSDRPVDVKNSPTGKPGKQVI
jgi:hypothetical protein